MVAWIQEWVHGYRNGCMDTGMGAWIQEWEDLAPLYITSKGLFTGIQNDLVTDDFEGWEPCQDTTQIEFDWFTWPLYYLGKGSFTGIHNDSVPGYFDGWGTIL